MTSIQRWNVRWQVWPYCDYGIGARCVPKDYRRMLLLMVGNEVNLYFDTVQWSCYKLQKRGDTCREVANGSKNAKITGTIESSRCGYDWSDQAEEGPNYALMAYSSSSSDSEVSFTCSKTCLKTVETLKSQYDQLHKDFKKSELMVVAYKIGLQSVEKILEFYKKNESIYEEKIKVLKFEIECKDIAISDLRKKLEIAQKEKDGIQFNVDKFENSSKSLNKLLESQIVNNYKKGLGYNAVPPLFTRNFMPLTPDLSFTGLEEFISEPLVIKPIVENTRAKASEAKSKIVKKNNGALIIEDWVFDSEEYDVPHDKNERKTVKSSFAKIKFVKSKKQVKSPRKTTIKQGTNFKMINKACHVCRSFDHLQYDCDNHQRQFNNKKIVKPMWNYTQRVNHQNFSQMTYPNPKRNMVPKAVLMRSGKVNTARPKAVLNVVKGNHVNVVKASACWVWKPKNKVIDHVSKHNSASMKFKRFDYIDAQGISKSEKGVIGSGCSRHMIGNVSYLTDFEEINGGYVAFGGNPKGGKITGRDTIKTVPRKNNMYSVDLKNIVPKGGLNCLFVKATSNEFKLWHRRLGHRNFKTMNKLVKGNLVRGLLLKLFENDQTCVACQKGKQHRASSTKDETSDIFKSFITRVENLINQRVKVIRCDNETEFKNKEMNQFCERKGIKREFSIARTPQQNGVAERKNRTLIEAARTMLVDSKLPTTFWAEAVNAACYVQNRCPVTILNTIDHLGKFDGKADEGFFIGYSISSKAFRVFNSRTKIVEENMHVQLLGIRGFCNLMLLVQVCVAAED
ncbi:putative ribonuclease H-like domain-containing protein [Tanacetum coccineum]